MSRYRCGALALGILLTAAGCATLDSFSGSGSMRIDVEVYKGPLAQDPWTQFGELAGAMNEAATSFFRYRVSLENIHQEYRCPRQVRKPPSKTSDTTRGETLKDRGPAGTAPGEPGWPPRGACEYLEGLLSDSSSFDEPTEALWKLYGEVEALPVAPGPDPEGVRAKVRQTLRRVVEVATRMRAKAYFWAGNQVTDMPQNRWVRAYMVTFSFLASEYSNQIATRADALLQQMAGPDRRELPLSLHLRNANANDFINLYIWNRAVAPALIEDMLSRPGAAFSSTETADRARAYERLFGDYNWSNVNTVYASGQGDVAMAFIKDDIGNWNLKSFDNDPTELLKAYTNLGKKALAEAVKLVGAASGVGGFGAAAGAADEAIKGASQLVDLANRVAYNRTAASRATVGGLDVAALHARVRAAIARLESQARSEQESLTAKIASTAAEIADLEKKANDARAAARTERSKKKGEEAAFLAQAADFEREAERNRLQVFELDQQILKLESDIQQGVATSTAGEPTPEKRLETLQKQRESRETVRKKNLADAATARNDAAAAAQIESAARTLESGAAVHDSRRAKLQEENDARRKRSENLVTVYAVTARNILARHQEIVELLQEGIATAPPGASRDPGRATAPALPSEAAGQAGRLLPR